MCMRAGQRGAHVCPSQVTTGSIMSRCVMGQQYASGMSTSLPRRLPPREPSTLVASAADADAAMAAPMPPSGGGASLTSTGAVSIDAASPAAAASSTIILSTPAAADLRDFDLSLIHI